MVRWAWRLFRREWRQHLLILLLVIVAVAAVVVGSAVAVNTPPPANAGFGTADDLATFNVRLRRRSRRRSSLAHVQAHIARLEQRYGPVQVIENETQRSRVRADVSAAVTGPPRPVRRPMLQLVSGHYPTGPDQIAVTPGLASAAERAGRRHLAPRGQAVVGIVQNPQSLLDEFALVAAGTGDQSDTGHRVVRRPWCGPGPHRSERLHPRPRRANTNGINPQTIVLTVATVGMLLIALVSIGGFTVLAQRRLRALGMLESMGATDRNVRLVIRANGGIVGIVGAVVGFALGLAVWLAYRPHDEQTAHHLIPMFALPWAVIIPAMVLAVVATFFAADRPGPRHHPRPGRQRPGRTPAAAAPDPPLVHPRGGRARDRVRLLLLVRRGATEAAV